MAALSAVVPQMAHSAPTFNSCADAKRIQLKSCQPFLLSDTMPGDDYNERSSRSATSPGAFGLQGDEDGAAGFSTPSSYGVLLKVWIWRSGSELGRTSSTFPWSTIDSGRLPLERHRAI